MSAPLHYPAGLPEYFTRDLSGSPFMPRSRFESESGDLIDIPLGTVDFEDIACALILTRDHYHVFRRWVRHDLKSGSQWFYGPHPLFRDRAQLKFTGNPNPYEFDYFTPLEIRVTMALRVKELA